MAFGNYRFEARNEIPHAVGLVAFLIVACLLGCLAISNYAVKARLPKKAELIDWFWILLAIPFAAYIAAYFLYHIYQIYTKETRIPFSETPVYTILFCIVMICLGVIFFAFRLRQRFWYGFFESVVGACIATLKFYSDVLLASNQIEVTPVAIAILTGGIYLMVRGLDNMHQGLENAKTGQRIMRVFSPKKSNETKTRDDWR